MTVGVELLRLQTYHAHIRSRKTIHEKAFWQDETPNRGLVLISRIDKISEFQDLKISDLKISGQRGFFVSLEPSCWKPILLFFLHFSLLFLVGLERLPGSGIWVWVRVEYGHGTAEKGVWYG